MRLKNKKTGEIKDFLDVAKEFINGKNGKKTFTLAELNADWEDAPEEPKVGYIIDPMEEDYVSEDDSGYEEPDVERAKELGIWLETKEEAELAVRKLKAWQRLKDKGFRFTGITRTSFDMDCIQFEIGNDFYNEQSLINSKLNKDLVLLFSGGEE